jgi:hypothetical protein
LRGSWWPICWKGSEFAVGSVHRIRRAADAVNAADFPRFLSWVSIGLVKLALIGPEGYSEAA